MDQIRQLVDNMSPGEVSSTLEQILALGAAAQQQEFDRGRNRPVDLPASPSEVAALTLRIDVDDVSPKVWRRLTVRGDLTLDRVHQVIQSAFGWNDTHLHRFWPGPQRQIWSGPYLLTDYDVGEGDEGTLETDVRLDQLLRRPGDRLFYTYDFGDDWTHTLRLESVDSLDPEAPPALCRKARNAGPLEDSGGPHGYNELVEAYAVDPSLAHAEEFREWVPQGWDPREAEVDAVNAELQGLVSGEGDDPQDPTVFGRRRQKEWPASLEALQGNLAPDVAARITALCAEARAADGSVGEDDLTAIARPFRYLVELAGEDGIPLTQAGWIKPTLVKQILTDLDLDRPWLSRSPRENTTPPVSNLRDICQQLGLLRKRKGRLLASRQAKTLGTDREYISFVTASLLVDKHSLVSAVHGLYALCVAASRGDTTHERAQEVADLLLACGINFGTSGRIDPWDVIDVVRRTWLVLGDARGESGADTERYAVALAKAALWPQEFLS